jgi:hypothetical protein
MMPINDRTRDRLALTLAIAQGPACMLIGYSMNLVYSAGAFFFFFWCALVVPFVIVVSTRSGLLTWQLAIASLTLSVIGDNLRVRAIDHREIVSVTFIFWAVGSLLSSPVPLFQLLRPMTPRNRLIVGCSTILAGGALWFAVKRITG